MLKIEVLFCSITPTNNGQLSKAGTVSESWECVDFKTVPDFEIWPRFDGDIEGKRKGLFFYGHSVCKYRWTMLIVKSLLRLKTHTCMN